MTIKIDRGLFVFRLLFGIYLYLSMGLFHASAGEVDVADARILIDISGSMKKNDPKNLRRPALRLLVGLMPEDARAGVWTFGRYVNMMIPLGQVDRSWKKRARAAAAKIASPGQFTNIEDVIKRSISDWESASTIYRRHLILLTDGVVDISKNSVKNQASRERILEQLLPKLKAYGARVHTIALSERADHELLQKLSKETDGWYEQVNDADQLQRIFLRIFEKVGQPDTVPLKNNRFQIDNSIQEVTLLVFRKEGAAPTTLTTPGGKKYDAKKAPKSVTWHRDVGFDMITISKPESGEWQVEAAMDPDNRVMVVTDLKMKSTSLPTRFVLGEQIPLTVKFTNQGKTITRKDFLKVVNLQSEEVDSQGPGEARPIFDDGSDGDAKAGDGLFTFLVGDRPEGGSIELIVRAEGQTFQRESRQRFELAEPIKTEVARDTASGISVTYTPDGEVVDITSLVFESKLVAVTGDEQQPVMVLPGAQAGDQALSVDPEPLLGDWKLQTTVKGKTSAGNDLLLTLPFVNIAGKASPPPPEPKPEPKPEPEPEPEPKEPPPPESEVKPEPVKEPEPEKQEEPEPEESSLMDQAILFGVGNLIVLLIGGGVFWFMRRKKSDSVVRVEDEELDEEAETKDEDDKK